MLCRWSSRLLVKPGATIVSVRLDDAVPYPARQYCYVDPEAGSKRRVAPGDSAGRRMSKVGH